MTLVMFPVLVFMYVRDRVEGEALRAFGAVYPEYTRQTPRLDPALGMSAQ